MSARRRYPALARFLDGYFHQDFAIEHGDPVGAARAFVRDASPAERASAARDLTRFIEIASGQLAGEWRSQLGGLGGAWHPRSLGVLRTVLAILNGSQD